MSIVQFFNCPICGIHEYEYDYFNEIMQAHRIKHYCISDIGELKFTLYINGHWGIAEPWDFSVQYDGVYFTIQKYIEKYNVGNWEHISSITEFDFKNWHFYKTALNLFA